MPNYRRALRPGGTFFFTLVTHRRGAIPLRRPGDLDYNPIKHGLAECAHAWPWSSFHRLVRAGVYDARWYCGCDRNPAAMPDFDGLHTESIELAFGE